MQLRVLGFSALLGAAAAALEEDVTALFQLRATEQDFEEIEELWSERSFTPYAAQVYAFERYENGEMAEGRGKDGAWLPVFVTGRGVGNSWNIHVSDTYPGYDLPNVPSNLVRKKLSSETADYYVDNTALQHHGLGIKYRHSKDMHDKSEEFAPWGQIVVGHDEGDGWLKVSAGYLPVEVHGAKVLSKKERKSYVARMPQEFDKLIAEAAARRQEEAALAAQQKVMAPIELVTYETGERVTMKTRQGTWYNARIAGPAAKPNAYDVIVQVDEFSVYPVKNIPAARIRKTHSAAHVAQPGESPMCQKEGCIEIHAKPEGSDTISLHISPKMGTEMLMKMACNKMKIEWGDCLTRVTFTHKGEQLAAGVHMHDASLEDQDTVDVSVAPPLPTNSSLLEDA